MVATGNPTILEARSRGVYPTDKPLSPATPGSVASFGGIMEYEDLTDDEMNEELYWSNYRKYYEPEYEPEEDEEVANDERN
jgi:hypothetical protein